MASAWYPTTGIPADTVGSDGDFARDAVNRIDYGPKGRVTAGSWVGTAIAINGPTGPAILSGSGAPGSSLGNNGQSYFDAVAATTYLKSSNAWTAAGTIVGAQGPAGAVLSAFTAQYGPIPSSSSMAVTTTMATIPQATSGLPCIYQPNWGSAFLGAYIQNNSSYAYTYQLYDLTTSTIVYTSPSVASSSYLQTAFFAATTYPMVANHQYVWQVNSTTASATGPVVVYPIYSMPSSSTTPALGPLPAVGFSTSTSITSTAATLPPFGTTATPYYVPVRTGSLNYAQCCFTATGSTATTATAKLYLYYQPLTGSTTVGTSTYTPITITADGVYRNILTQPTDASAFSSSYRFFWQIVGNQTMTATLLLQTYGLV